MSVTRSCPVCGYTRDYPTAAQAEARHRRHSCHRQTQLAAAARRSAQRAAGELTRDCPHPGHPHRHGTRSAYIRDQCRCLDCTAANTAASRQTRRRRHLGQTNPYVDPGPVRAHIAALHQAGIGYQQIGRLAGTSGSHIREIAGLVARSADRPPLRQVRRATARRILAVEPTPTNRAAHSQVDATGTQRRLQALIATGWPARRLAEQLGRRPDNLRRSMTGATVTAGTARLVHDLHERLWNTPPTATTRSEQAGIDQARRHARAQGWLPPLSWDDIDTDPDPPCHPTPDPGDVDEIAVERAVTGDGIHLGELTHAEQAEAIRRLTDRGKSLRQIAEQLATTTRTVSRRRGTASAA